MPRRRAPFSQAVAVAIGLQILQPAAQATDAPAAFLVDGSLSATDNGNPGIDGGRRGDLVAILRPEVRWKRRSPLLDVDLSAAVTLLGSANGASQSGVLPDVNATLRSTWWPQWFYVDAGVRVRQTERDPYGTRADDPLASNRRTEGIYNLSPHLEHLVADNTLLFGAYDATLSTNGSGAGRQARSDRAVVRLERLPTPIGVSAQWSYLETASRDVGRSRLTVETGRVSAGAALGPDWVASVVAGQDHSRFSSGDYSDPLYGIDAKWNPTPRTSVALNVEHRFFGAGGNLAATHRTPYLSFGLTLSRQPATAAVALRALGSAADLRSYLDAILTTRNPDPAARGAMVDALVRDQGLDTRLPTASSVVADYPQLKTGAVFDLTLLDRRGTTSLSVFVQTLRRLTHRGQAPVVTDTFADDNRQSGAAFQMTRRLGPQMTANASVRWSRTSGSAERSGEVANETLYRLSLLRQVSPKSTVSAGVQYRHFTSAGVARLPFDATTVFIGASHSF